MSKAKLEMVPQLVFPPKDPKTCKHHWNWYTYFNDLQIVSKKLCFYCKKVEDA